MDTNLHETLRKFHALGLSIYNLLVIFVVNCKLMKKEGTVISVTNYAKLHGLTRQAIIKRLKNNKPLPGVKYCYKSGGKTSHYILIME